jgi:hypothetical protein
VTTDTKSVADAPNFFEYAEKHELALFPMAYGSKAPHGIVASFAHDWSRRREDWNAWRATHKCNFGIVAGPSRIIAVDVDTAEVGPERAWNVWTEWCMSSGLPVYQPHTATARGGWHVLFLCPPDLDIETLRQVPLIGPIEGVSKKAVIDLRVKNGFVVAPESFYNGNPKGEASGMYRLLADTPPYPAPGALLAACARKLRVSSTARPGTADVGDVEKALTWMAGHDCFAPYDRWREIGMILRSEFGDDPGFALWQITNDGSCSADDEFAKWASFAADPRSDGVGIGTLRHNAKAAGCPHHIRQSTASMFQGIAEAAGASLPPRLPQLPYTPSPSLAPELPPLRDLIKTSDEFVRDFIPPDYVVDGILQRRFCYALTAKTGVGKTTVAMLLAGHVAIGRRLGSLDVAKGTVVYFAGENPTDIQMRWLGLTQEMKIDPASTDVHFVPGVVKFSKVAAAISAEVERKKLRPVLIIVDTVAAYFEGDNDNDNVQMGDHARMLRSLTLLPGGPSVLCLAHPTKGAGDDDLIPKGGGAFINEIDGNIALRKRETVLAASALGKFRGPEFPPLYFELKAVRHPVLKDTRGRDIPTIVARALDDDGSAALDALGMRDEDRMLRAVEKHPRYSLRQFAVMLGLKHHSKVERLIQALTKQKLIKREGRTLVLTQAGQKELNAQETPSQGHSSK